LVNPAPLISAVAEDGGVVADDDRPVPWWSFTKTALAAASLVLVAQNRLALDEPIKGRAFTLRHLLQHRAGLRDYGTVAAYHEAVATGETPWSPTEMLRRARAEALLFAPGQGWNYSNIGYFYVRTLLEEVVGAPIGEVLRQFVLEPLEITDASIATSAANLTATAWGNPKGYDPGWVYHGLLIGSAASAAVLLRRLLAARLFPAPLLAAMLTPVSVPGPFAPQRPWRSGGYGIGLMIVTTDTPGRYIGHTGGGPDSTAAVFQYAHEGDIESSGRTAAAFAPLSHPATVEHRAVMLSRHP
jgi:D-alanyl-D-alanine carboxypeptidase